MKPFNPSNNKRWPLWTQITISLLIALLVVNLITAPIARYMESEFELGQVEEHSRNAFSLLATSVIDAVITEDIPLLETIATRSLKQSSNMTELSIENEENIILVKHERKHNAIEKNLHKFSYIIEHEGEKFGRMNIEWDITHIYKEIDRHVEKIQFFISTMLILLTIITVILIHWLSVRPIHRINKYLISLSQNKEFLPLPLTVFASREIELLTSSANDLAEMTRSRVKRELELLSTREELLVANEEAHSASRAKSGFLATMSHEIRTPMNAILGILGLLKDTSLDNQQQQLVRTGRESGELLLTIINDILDFSKMEADKLQLEHSGFNLHQLLTQSVDLLHHQAESKGLSLALILEPDLPLFAKGDPDRLRQILINLINNAVKFTTKGNIIIRAKLTTNNSEKFGFHCSVTDTGIGIDKNLQASLFEEFSMADQSHSRSHEGTGLGLAISKHLVSLMNGYIGLSSEPGNGSTFAFSIQLEHAEEKDCDIKQELDTPQFFPDNNIRILLAEDNPANQMVIKNILEFADLQVDIVANGREAVEAVRSLPYDIVLMDISMPEMDGMSATKEIRQLSNERSNVPIIALTAHALVGDKKRFLESGMNDYLSKPIDRNATLHCIAKWTNQNIEKVHNHEKGIETLIVKATKYSADNNYVDEKVLEQLANDTSPDIVPDLISLYISDANKRVQLIEEAIVNKDEKTLEFEAHTIGSSSAAHGNEKLHKIARKIERLCQEKNFKQAIIDAEAITEIASESFHQLELYMDKSFNTDKTGT